METKAEASTAPAASPVPGLSVAHELGLVEARLAELLASSEPRLTEIASYLVNSGGKRVRPAVTILIFHACGGRVVADVVDIAAALELIHSASLLHDDIIDGSHVRRGRDSALHKWGVAETLVTGDFLFSKAFQLCGRFDERLIGWATTACIKLTEGEIMQGRLRRNPTVTFADYMGIIHCKTAALFSQGARTAAYLAQADEGLIDAMGRCGEHVGLTFQMIDDLLDVTAPEAQLGKPQGLDIREGMPSLPMVLALERQPELRPLFAKPELSEPEFERMLRRLQGEDILAEGYRLAHRHATEARAALATLPVSRARDELHGLVDQLVARMS